MKSVPANSPLSGLRIRAGLLAVPSSPWRCRPLERLLSIVVVASRSLEEAVPTLVPRSLASLPTTTTHGPTLRDHFVATVGPQAGQGSALGPLLVLADATFAPRSRFPLHPHRDMEILSIVLDGELSHHGDQAHATTVRARSAQMISARDGMMHAEGNDTDHPTRMLQIWFQPDARGGAPAYFERTFSDPGRHLVAGDAAMPLRADARVWWHDLAPRRVERFATASRRRGSPTGDDEPLFEWSRRRTRRGAFASRWARNGRRGWRGRRHERPRRRGVVDRHRVSGAPASPSRRAHGASGRQAAPVGGGATHARAAIAVDQAPSPTPAPTGPDTEFEPDEHATIAAPAISPIRIEREAYFAILGASSHAAYRSQSEKRGMTNCRRAIAIAPAAMLFAIAVASGCSGAIEETAPDGDGGLDDLPDAARPKPSRDGAVDAQGGTSSLPTDGKNHS